MHGCGAQIYCDGANMNAIMGIVNVTPDSFSDGGVDADEVVSIEAALGVIHRLLTSNDEEIADLVDGDARRPGVTDVEAQRSAPY